MPPVTFFTANTAKAVWKSVTGVSSAGMKRGRGRGVSRMVKDFNQGQALGEGRKKLVIPGLNAPLATGRKPTVLESAGENASFQDKITEARQMQNVYRKFREKPIDRGWSGRRAHGKRAGPPDEYDDHIFEGFDSKVLMLRPLFGMSGVLGRTKKMHALVVTGNENGLAGFSTAIGNDPRSVVRHARNRAAQSLVSIPLCEGHTVMHNFFSKYHATTVFVEKKPKGYGIRAHRVIQSICEAFGIQDLLAKVEGSSTNQINITKAFFLGLMNQRRYEDMANEKGLHLVEVNEQNYFYPKVLASPEGNVRLDDEIKQRNENIDFTYYIHDGKIRQVKGKRPSTWMDSPKYYRFLDKKDYRKNREKVKLMLAAKYGDKKVKDIFPYFISNATSFYKAKPGDKLVEQI